MFQVFNNALPQTWSSALFCIPAHKAILWLAATGSLFNILSKNNLSQTKYCHQRQGKFRIPYTSSPEKYHSSFFSGLALHLPFSLPHH
jgi:hypothetical protein